MKKLIILFLLASNFAFAQDHKDLMISLGIGMIGSPSGRYFKSPEVGLGYAIDANYFIKKRHIFSLNYTTGNHEYVSRFNEDISKSTAVSFFPISKVEFRSFSLMYKYRLIDINRFSMALGTGLGILTHLSRFPLYEENNNFWQFQSFAFAGSSNLAFPFKAELSFNISQHWTVGVESGIFLMPDFPWSGFHLLPRVSYIF